MTSRKQFGGVGLLLIFAILLFFMALRLAEQHLGHVS